MIARCVAPRVFDREPLPLPGSRFAVDVQVVNLTETERTALRAMIAMLSDPGLYMLRQEFIYGDVCLVVEDGEVTWAPVPSDPQKEAA